MPSPAVANAIDELVSSPKTWLAAAAGPAAWGLATIALQIPAIAESGFNVSGAAILIGLLVAFYAASRIIDDDSRLGAICLGIGSSLLVRFHLRGTADRSRRLNQLLAVQDAHQLYMAALLASHLYPETPGLEQLSDDLLSVSYQARDAGIVAEFGGTPESAPVGGYQAGERRLRDAVGDAKIDAVWDQAGRHLEGIARIGRP